jgi:cytochrome c5
MVQDYDLYLRLTMDGSHPICIHEPLVRYNLHGNNASKDYRLAHDEGARVLAAHEALARRRGDLAAVQAAKKGATQNHRLYAEQALQSYRRLAHSRQPVQGAPHLGRALAWAPLSTTGTILRNVRRRVIGHHSVAHN